MAKPLIAWEKLGEFTENVVWSASLDERYHIEVQRRSERIGYLVIFDHNDSDKELLREEVSLAYGAVFGPDVDDVSTWQERCTSFIDNELPKTAPPA